MHRREHTEKMSKIMCSLTVLLLSLLAVTATWPETHTHTHIHRDPSCHTGAQRNANNNVPRCLLFLIADCASWSYTHTHTNLELRNLLSQQTDFILFLVYSMYNSLHTVIQLTLIVSKLTFLVLGYTLKHTNTLFFLFQNLQQRVRVSWFTADIICSTKLFVVLRRCQRQPIVSPMSPRYFGLTFPMRLPSGSLSPISGVLSLCISRVSAMCVCVCDRERERPLSAALRSSIRACACWRSIVIATALAALSSCRLWRDSFRKRICPSHSSIYYNV